MRGLLLVVALVGGCTTHNANQLHAPDAAVSLDGAPDTDGVSAPDDFATPDPDASPLVEGATLDGGAPDGGCQDGSPTSSTHCGACGHDCTALSGVQPTIACSAGVCQVAAACLPYRKHCSSNPDDGCEVELESPLDCGGCDVVCPAAKPLCSRSSGTYACQTSCGGETPVQCGDRCVTIQGDVRHCGGCSRPCAPKDHAVASCAGGNCAYACTSGFHKCGGECADNTSVASCGSRCDPCVAPANGTAICVGGSFCSFRCADGFAKIGAGCVAGVAWNDQADHGASDTSYHAVWDSAADDLYVTGGLTAHSSGDGKWTSFGAFGPRGIEIWGSGAKDVWIGSTDGTLFHFTGSWAESRISADVLEQVYAFSVGQFYAVGEDYEVVAGVLNLRTFLARGTSAGSWQRQTMISDGRFGASTVFAPPSGELWYGSGSLVKVPGGIQAGAPAGKSFRDIWGASATNLYAVGTGGLILHTENGTDWIPESSTVTSDLNGVHGGASGVYAVGAAGVILERASDGSWAQENLGGATTTLRAVWVAPDGGVYIVGDQGVILYKKP